MQTAFLVFPHQLYKHLPVAPQQASIYIIEYPLFFTQYNFHKQKLTLHRASMKCYEQYLLHKGYQVFYIEYHQHQAKLDILFKELLARGVNNIHCHEPTDYLLERRLQRYCSKHALHLRYHTSPNFIRTSTQNSAYFAEKRFFLTDYYVNLRKELHIMVPDGKPQGGKWTYDTENRKKMPSNVYVPPLPNAGYNKYTQEAIAYVSQHFKNNYGNADSFCYPINFAEAEAWLDTFLQERFTHYGVYQDAIVRHQNWLFHSVLTPMLNIGLLSPMMCWQKP